MTRRQRSILFIVSLVTVGALVAVVAWIAVGAGGSGSGSQQAGGSDDEQDPQVLGEAFLDDWVDNGRVVRRDQGDDTVSEGQAYGLLLAVATGRENDVDEIWDWTTANLVRDDGLLSWQWSDGAVVDDEPASDADLDAARALVLAGDRFERPDLTEAGTTLATAIINEMTVETAAGRILLPGPWALAMDPHPYNPSYSSPAAYSILEDATGDSRWAELAAGSAAVTTTLLEQTLLPPDWAQVHSDGTITPRAGASGTDDSVDYSYDAARLALRYAESCEASDVALAAKLAPTLSRTGNLPAQLDLGGGNLTTDEHPLAYAARAAAEASAGNLLDANNDLARAAELSESTPTYYGTAWTALAGFMVTDTVLGGCAVLEETSS